MSGLLRFKQTVKDAVSRLPGGEWLVKQRFAKFGPLDFGDARQSGRCLCCPGISLPGNHSEH